MHPPKRSNNEKHVFIYVYKKSGIYFISVIILFLVIGLLTAAAPAYRFSSQTLTNWTSDLDSSTFLYLMGMENRAFQNAYPDDKPLPDLTSTLFHMATSIKPDDPRSLLGQELPGFQAFDSKIIVAGEGTDYTTLPVESAPPLEEILKEREAIVDESGDKDEETPDKPDKNQPTTGDRDVVFIYNTHNTESFLPHLPGTKDKDSAHHSEVNVGKISERLGKRLEENGIGTKIDNTNIMGVLNKRGWQYGQSYAASREVVKEAMANNKATEYAIDIHRDSLSKDKTTKVINGKAYARTIFVVGEEYASYEKNLALAWKLHYLINEKYPGLSRGVITKKGPLNNGVYNQDLSPNAMLIEFGGVENNFKELYRTADAIADVFSDYYWDAEKVNKD